METLKALHGGGSLFYLDKYGYTLGRPLNNRNRWNTKIVLSVFDRDSKRLVSTTYAKRYDYLRFIETSTFLKCKDVLSPEILKLFPGDKTAICGHIGEFLQDYILAYPQATISSLIAVFDYLKYINSLKQKEKHFIAPSIIKLSLKLSKDIESDFEFLPKFREILPHLEKSNIKFTYGYGIEDPHVWNFRILNYIDSPVAFTTDFDYFSDTLNYHWEIGYLYATFRWLRKLSPGLTHEAEDALLSLTQEVDDKSMFMFWLGALSSYCGYKDSLCSFLKGEKTEDLEKKHFIIKELDEKVTCLADNLLK